MGQLIAHGIGDYILQSTWMALHKNKVSWICALHCFTYTLCFLPLTLSWKALLVIFASHFVMDRFGLARYIVWLKEQQSTKPVPWRLSKLTGYFDQETLTGDDKERDYFIRVNMEKTSVADLIADPNVNRPIWIRVWLTIVADNTIHMLCNALAIAYL